MTTHRRSAAVRPWSRIEAMERRVLFSVAAGLEPQAPFPGPDPHPMPGMIRAVDFDRGGEDVSYNDNEPENTGDLPNVRPGEGVDTGTIPDEFGDGRRPGPFVVDARPGEWLEYTINVPRAGKYGFRSNTYDRHSFGTIHVEFNGVDKTGSFPMSDVGTPTNPAGRFVKDGIQLDAGVQVMRVVFETGIQGRDQLFATGGSESFGLVAVPVVTVTSINPVAREDEPGFQRSAFSVAVEGHDQFEHFTINLRVGGSAQHGVDYYLDPGPVEPSITLVPGEHQRTLTMYNFDDDLVEGPETATLTVLPGAHYDVGEDSTAVNTILDDELGSLTGVKFNDANGNGVKDAGDVELGSGWLFYLDADNDGVFDADVERSSVTGGNGRYRFDQLTAGTYRVREVQQAGWTLTSPAAGAHVVTLADGQNVTDLDFLNTRNLQAASIGGVKFDDRDGDGLRDPGEPGLAGHTIYLDSNNNGVLDQSERRVLTAGDGRYKFENVSTSGVKRVRQLPRSGFRRTFPATAGYDFTISAGQQVTGRDFGVTRNVLISGTVFLDANGNRVRDAGERALSNRRVYLDLNNNGVFNSGEPSVLTSSTGAYAFKGRPAGTYRVRIVRPSGFSITTPTGGLYTLTLTAGQTATGRNFGLRQV